MLEHLTYVWGCLREPLKKIFAMIGIAFCFTFAVISLFSAAVIIVAGMVVFLDANILGFIQSIILCAAAFFVTALSIAGVLACNRIIESH